MALGILLVTSAGEATPPLADALEQAGFRVAGVVGDTVDLYDAMDRHCPDAVLIAADSPRRDILEHLAGVGRRFPRPMVVLAEHADSQARARAAEAGISVYVLDHLSPPLVQSMVEVAVQHYRRETELAAELATTRQSLQERRLVDRAKCVLMEREGLREAEAYHRLRRLAMDGGVRLVQAAADLLARQG